MIRGRRPDNTATARDEARDGAGRVGGRYETVFAPVFSVFFEPRLADKAQIRRKTGFEGSFSRIFQGFGGFPGCIFRQSQFKSSRRRRPPDFASIVVDGAMVVFWTSHGR